jgi:hypothetical protein
MLFTDLDEREAFEFAASLERAHEITMVDLAHLVVAVGGDVEAMDAGADGLDAFAAWFNGWRRDGSPGIDPSIESWDAVALGADGRPLDSLLSAQFLGQYIRYAYGTYNPAAHWSVKVDPRQEVVVVGGAWPMPEWDRASIIVKGIDRRLPRYDGSGWLQAALTGKNGALRGSPVRDYRVLAEFVPLSLAAADDPRRRPPVFPDREVLRGAQLFTAGEPRGEKMVLASESTWTRGASHARQLNADAIADLLNRHIEGGSRLEPQSLRGDVPIEMLGGLAWPITRGGKLRGLLLEQGASSNETWDNLLADLRSWASANDARLEPETELEGDH